jgi:hypothetical protein
MMRAFFFTIVVKKGLHENPLYQFRADMIEHNAYLYAIFRHIKKIPLGRPNSHILQFGIFCFKILRFSALSSAQIDRPIIVFLLPNSATAPYNT